jgi:hypothetical protein
MKHHAALLGFLVLGAACDSNSSRLPTSPSVPSATTPSVPTSPSVALREITVGEEVTGTVEVHGAEHIFELTAPSDGTLLARLSWPPAQGRLELWLADTLSSQSATPPIAGKLTVVAGRKYRVKVADYAAWDYDHLFLPYVLTTHIQ